MARDTKHFWRRWGAVTTLLLSAAGVARADFISSLTIAPTTPPTAYYAAGINGIFGSADRGVTWQFLPASGLTQKISAVAFDPSVPATLFAGSFGEVFNVPYIGGVYKSTDAGTTWSFSTNGLQLSGFVTAIVVDPSTSDTVYAASYGDGIFKSTDGGNAWSKTTGPDGALVLLIDPHAPMTLYAGTGSYAVVGSVGQPGTVLKSTDGGMSWQASAAGLPAASIVALAVDPQTPTTLYAATVETVTNGGGRSGVFKSVDAGGSWTPANTGLPADRPGVFALAIDPQTPSTLYAGTATSTYTGAGAGVFKSMDGAATWTALEAGLSETEITALAVDPIASRTVYVGTKSGNVLVVTQSDVGPTPTPVPASSCIGDCNGDGQVTVDEVLQGVNIVLGALPPSACAAFGCSPECRPGPIPPTPPLPTVACLIPRPGARFGGSI